MHAGYYKVRLIKDLRGESGIGLKESKDIIDDSWAGYSLAQVLINHKSKTSVDILKKFYYLTDQARFEIEDVQKTKLGRLLYV